MADFNSVATQFTQFYYQTFDAGRQNLAGLYRENSMLTFETNQVQGVASIIDKLTSLPFKSTQHKIVTSDAQPSNDSGGILVMVTGQLVIDDSEHPQNYAQTFQILPDGSGSYYVFNDVFRLLYG
ncbi:Nuclear transport factor 2 [Bacidia gigantensis]|uniref:Nuclear transport factor 2 n=1 Tax=Bacidia gigantensis TaxID=2732470 RepID=UPI001D04C546|nr:Nuclear transport factor 2 [Bacidia gigantensis]KAG8525977.1 Nuclear transport factor 2 [Bacidia gigantensis]